MFGRKREQEKMREEEQEILDNNAVCYGTKNYPVSYIWEVCRNYRRHFPAYAKDSYGGFCIHINMNFELLVQKKETNFEDGYLYYVSASYESCSKRYQLNEKELHMLVDKIIPKMENDIRVLAKEAYDALENLKF
jgi:hypothetical protein